MRSIDDLELRAVTSDELTDWMRAIELTFAEDPTDVHLQRWRERSEPGRSLGAFDGGRIVGSAAAFSYTMSMPWAGPVPCAGVTAVSVAADWRRRGLLRRMMVEQLHDIRDRGEPVASLWASEAPIYGRFGYGVAAPHQALRVERRWAELEQPADDLDLVTLVDVETARSRFPAIYDRLRRQRGGVMSLDETWWRSRLWDPREEREGAGSRMLGLIPERGYVMYRVKPRWAEHVPVYTLRVEELVAVDRDAHAALWSFAFGVDLVGTVRASVRPPDDPLPWLVTNRARVAAELSDPMYLRILDVAAALTARGYRTDGRLVLALHDDLFPDNAGRWELEVRDGKASCDRTDAAPDLELHVRELASLLLGGVSATALLWSRRIEERSTGAASRADLLFSVDLAPWCVFIF